MPTEDLGPEDRYLIAANALTAATTSGQPLNSSHGYQQLLHVRRQERTRFRLVATMRQLADAILDGQPTAELVAQMQAQVAERASR